MDEKKCFSDERDILDWLCRRLAASKGLDPDTLEIEYRVKEAES